MKNMSFKLSKLIKNRSFRSYLSLLLALITFVVIRKNVTSPVAFMTSWIVFATTHLIFSWWIILSFHPREVRAVSKDEDLNATIIFFLVICAAFISLFAIVLLLQTIPDMPKRGLNLHILLSIGAVFSSWVLVHTIFTLRY